VHPGKTETCVLDFNNQAEDIQNAFQPYYERTILDGETDPNAVYELRRRLIDLDLYSQEDAHQFCLILFNKKAGHEQLASFLDPLVRKFTSELEGEERVELRKVMRQFVNGYAFLARIIPFSDQNLEEYYQFSRHIVRLLPTETTEMPTYIQELVNMTSLRITTTSSGEIPLVQGQGILEPRAITVGSVTGDEDLDTLSSIIEALNERFGVNLDEGDRLFLEGVLHELRENPTIERSMNINEPDDVKRTFDHTVGDIMSNSVDKRFQFVKKFLDNTEFREDMLGMLFTEILHNSKLNEEDKIMNLIAQGESKTVEWKSTLRYCIKTKENKVGYIEHSVVKTIAAFLNTHPGGSLLIGVEEDEQQKGVIRGNAEDNFATNDVCERHIIQIINRDIGNLWSVDVDPKAVEIEGKNVVKVKVDRSSKPAWCKKGDKLVFYVRQGPITTPLTEEEAEEYIKLHW
jgi:type I site-specific restriction-modification system R (restriction) subunit